MTAIQQAELDDGDVQETLQGSMWDSVCPAYCSECGYLGDFEHDFRGPCPTCGCRDAGSLTHLYLGL